MTQHYKTVYFTDHPASESKRKSLTIAFGKRSGLIYDRIRDLSCPEIRQLLGTANFQELVSEASASDLPLNTHCVKLLTSSLRQIDDARSQTPLLPFDRAEHIFDPITVTFRGGSKEPYVRWYPFLEGYSPQFVEEILRRYAPSATAVLDPFAGTGTTAFAAANLNKRSYYCEVNPVLQFLAQTKIKVRSLDVLRRRKLADDLEHIADAVTSIPDSEPDFFLHEGYKATFGTSVFFDPSVYNQVLRARSWVDEVALERPLAADAVTVAVLASLVPASKMKRAGDLRYKTPKETQASSEDFLDSMRAHLLNMVRDIREDSTGIGPQPAFLCQPANCLDKIPPLNIDTVITSPPYLNGTNYFRNTKIELWFLRCLGCKEDLRAFRCASLTAGINDVSTKKMPPPTHPEVTAIVNHLKQVAYDRRIPKMIACYFHEITSVFRILLRHLVRPAVLAVDIGDSCYSGVHVPVDALLTACLHSIGIELTDRVTLRTRRSRGGMTLTQSLLIFRNDSRAVPRQQPHSPQAWKPDWTVFKTSLPHQTTPFSKRNWGHGWHSLCSYPGKLKPAIAHHLAKTFVPAGGRILDPFAGVGTIPFEAALQGKLAYGFEINPAAYAIAKAKLQQPRKAGCLKVVESLQIFLDRNAPTQQELQEAQVFGFNGKISTYYEHKTLREVLLARRYFRVHPADTPEHALVLASLLHILHGNRPYALSRRSHPLTPYKPSGSFEYKALIPHLKNKVTRIFEDPLPSSFRSGHVFHQDATKWWPTEVDHLDAVITSPPFFDSTRFYLANWLRLWFSGWSSRDFDARPKAFVEEQQKKGFDVYIPILRQARERLKPEGVAIFHLGKSIKCDMAQNLRKLSAKWFEHSEVFDESVLHCESHGIRDKGTVTSHQYLLLY